MNEKKIKDFDLSEITTALYKLESCTEEIELSEKFLRFVEYNRKDLELRIEALWKKENTPLLYGYFISVLKVIWEANGDIRYLNIILKLSDTQFFMRLQKKGIIDKSIVETLKEKLN